MERTILTTKDGSKTLMVNGLAETYHSHHGALQEARHVFIKNGFYLPKKSDISILELGFGTGLNLLVTFDEYLKSDKYHTIDYFSIEKYPVTNAEIEALGYDALFEDPKMAEIYRQIHRSSWEAPHTLPPNFTYTKRQADFFRIPDLHLPPIDLVYFDCFGARVQPDLWELPFLKLVTAVMAPGGLLTTYSSKGSTRRALESLGLTVEKVPGPPGKREMMRAWKP